jgi:hypothetical protein
VVLAERLPVESYLDLGDRANFNNSAVIRLFPDFIAQLALDTARLWEMRGAAPLVMTGPVLEKVRTVVGATAPPHVTPFKGSGY